MVLDDLDSDVTSDAGGID